MKREISVYVKDIIDSMTSIESFVGDMDFQKFIQDDKTLSAVIRKFEIIGEASKYIPEKIRALTHTCNRSRRIFSHHGESSAFVINYGETGGESRG